MSGRTQEFARIILPYEHVASLVEADSRPGYVGTHIRAGLDSDYLCVYATEETEETASDQLLRLGVEQKFMKEQQFKICNVNQIYADGFKSQEIIATYRKLYATAIDQGFKGFLVVRSAFDFFHNRGHMLETFLRYEMAFERARLPCKTTCLYPLGMMGPEHILSTMSSHSHVCTPSNAMTSHELFDLAFTGALSEILGESAARAIAFHLEQRACYSSGLIFEGLEALFGAEGARILIEPFHRSVTEIVGAQRTSDFSQTSKQIT